MNPSWIVSHFTSRQSLGKTQLSRKRIISVLISRNSTRFQCGISSSELSSLIATSAICHACTTALSRIWPLRRSNLLGRLNWWIFYFACVPTTGRTSTVWCRMAFLRSRWRSSLLFLRTMRDQHLQIHNSPQTQRREISPMEIPKQMERAKVWSPLRTISPRKFNRTRSTASCTMNMGAHTWPIIQPSAKNVRRTEPSRTSLPMNHLQTDQDPGKGRLTLPNWPSTANPGRGRLALPNWLSTVTSWRSSWRRQKVNFL